MIKEKQVTEKKQKTLEERMGSAPFIVTNVYQSFTDREKKLVLANVLNWAAHEIARIEGMPIDEEKRLEPKIEESKKEDKKKA